MANRYWVGGTGTWDGVSTTNWSATSGGAGGATVPGSADLVIFDANSNVAGGGASYTVTKTSATAVLGMQLAKPSGTGAVLTFAGSVANNLLGGGLLVSSAAEVNWTNSGQVNFTATTTTCATNGAVITSAVSVGGGSTVTLSGNFATSSTITCTTTGIINPNNFVCRCDNLALGTTTGRTIAFGAGGYFEFTGTANATYPSSYPTTWTSITGTPAILFSGVAGAGVTRTLEGRAFATGSVFCNVTVSAGTSNTNFTLSTGSQTLNNLTFTGYTGTFTSVNPTSINGNLTLSSGMVVTGTGLQITTPTTLTSTLTTNGVSLGSLTFAGGASSTLTLADNATFSGTLTLTSATLNVNGKLLTCSVFSSSNSNTRSIAFGTNGVIQISSQGGTQISMGTLNGFSWTGTGNFLSNIATPTLARSFVVGTTSGGSAANAINLVVGGGTPTINIGGYFNNLDLTGNSSNPIAGPFNLSSSSYICGNFTASATMSFAANVNTLTFAATSGPKSIDTKSLTINNNVVFDGVGGSWTLASNLNVGSSYTTTLTNGTVSLAGFGLQTGFLSSSNSNTRSIDFGTSGSITVGGSGASLISMSTVTGLTFSNVGTIYVAPSASATNNLVIGYGLTTYPDVVVSAGSSSISVGGFNCRSFTVSASYTGTINGVIGGDSIGFRGNLDFGGATIGTNLGISAYHNTSGTYTMSTGSITIYSFIFSPSGTGVTVQMLNSLSVNYSCNIFGAGGTTLDLQNNTITGTSNCAYLIDGSSGLTLAMGTGKFVHNSTTTSLTILTVSNTSAITITGSKRFETNANGAGVRTIAVNSTGVTPANSSTCLFDLYVTSVLTSGAINLSISSFRNVDFTGNRAPLNINISSTVTIYGNLTMGSGMTVSPADATSVLAMAGSSGTYTLTTNGVAMPQMTIGKSGSSGTWNFADTFTNKGTNLVANGLTLGESSGSVTINTNNNTIYSGSVTIGSVTTLNLGSSLFEVFLRSATFTCNASATINAGTSTVRSTYGMTFYGGGKTWYNISLTNTGYNLTIYNSNTFNDIQVNRLYGNYPAYIIESGTTQTLSNFTLNYFIMQGTTNAQYTLTLPSGTVSVSNSYIKSCNAAGGAKWYALYKNGNTNQGYNTGWIFSDGSESFFDFF